MKLSAFLTKTKTKRLFMNIEQVIKKLQWRCQGKYRIREYVRDYIIRCVTFCEPLQIITIWCVSKSLESRFARQNGFTALPTEHKTLMDFMCIHQLLKELGLIVNHFIFLVGSGVSSGQVESNISEQYLNCLNNLAFILEADVLIEFRPVANSEPLPPMLKVPHSDWFEALERETSRRIKLANHRGVKLTRDQADKEAQLSITVKANEARQLVEEFGDFILVPVEYVERYQFHNLGYAGFTNRLLPITKPYPWRMLD